MRLGYQTSLNKKCYLQILLNDHLFLKDNYKAFQHKIFLKLSPQFFFLVRIIVDCVKARIIRLNLIIYKKKIILFRE